MRGTSLGECTVVGGVSGPAIARTCSGIEAATRPKGRWFRGEPDQIPLARDFVRRHVQDQCKCMPGELGEIVLCVSETTTNAIRHTMSRLPGGGFWVVVRVDGSLVRVDVLDDGPFSGKEPPLPAPPARAELLEEGGRGLWLVAVYAQSTGYEETEHGIGHAWFTYALNGATPC
ncbi:MAG: hypothetical protein GEV03_06260 [Streptosporangiales bacterium]|nr:hypothetical protein [Streptosporangiales bacterium]